MMAAKNVEKFRKIRKEEFSRRSGESINYAMFEKRILIPNFCNSQRKTEPYVSRYPCLPHVDDNRVDRASATGTVDLGSIPGRIKP